MSNRLFRIPLLLTAAAMILTACAAPPRQRPRSHQQPKSLLQPRPLRQLRSQRSPPRRSCQLLHLHPRQLPCQRPRPASQRWQSTRTDPMT